MLFRSHAIVGQRDGPHLLIVAGVHGDEWEPMVAVRSIMDGIRPEDLSGRLTLIPIVNEPAYRRGQRAGDDGLDLARTCPGRSDGSETERIAFELCELMRGADYLIDLHTGGVQLRLWPLVGYMLHPDARVLDQQRRMAHAFNLPFVWGTDPSLNGRTLSAARDLGIPAIYAEYLGSAPFCDAAVAAYIQGCRNVMTALGMLPGTLPASEVRFVCEDPSPGSGYLQVCHPAPSAGLFRPLVELGSRVEVGEPIGSFIADGNESQVTIHADRSGRIISLRGIARVQAGDGLAVVVDVTEK
jgi:predicted deacylase